MADHRVGHLPDIKEEIQERSRSRRPCGVRPPDVSKASECVTVVAALVAANRLILNKKPNKDAVVAALVVANCLILNKKPNKDAVVAALVAANCLISRKNPRKRP